MSVADKHPEFEKYKGTWEKTRHAVKGSIAIKREKHEYLPVPDNNSSDEKRGTETVRYKQYLRRAVYTNFTGRTKNALIGAAFRKSPVIQLPTGVDYLLEDATGDGLSLEQLCKDELSNLMETGRVGFLVDYPAADENLSVAQISALQLRASVVPYLAENISNWKSSNINGRKVMTLIVLEENYFDGDDEFSHENSTQQRVLRLDEEGYSQQLYRDDEPFTEQFYPKKADGSKWEEIPFIFAGSKNNDSTIDDAPLADIAEINIAHYRNSADYEESCFLTGQPSLFITHSLNPEQFREYNPDGIKLGSRAGHVLGESGAATLVQAAANSLVSEAMGKKEQAMIMIGARIITDRGGNETAEGARIRFASENSVLGDVVSNLTEALKMCIKWISEFMGSSDEYEFYLNTEFYDKAIDPQLVMSMIQLLDRDIIGEVDIFERLQAGGLIDSTRTLDDVKSERGLANPLV